MRGDPGEGGFFCTVRGLFTRHGTGTQGQGTIPCGTVPAHIISRPGKAGPEYFPVIEKSGRRHLAGKKKFKRNNFPAIFFLMQKFQREKSLSSQNFSGKKNLNANVLPFKKICVQKFSGLLGRKTDEQRWVCGVSISFPQTQVTRNFFFKRTHFTGTIFSNPKVLPELFFQTQKSSCSKKYGRENVAAKKKIQRRKFPA